MDNIKDNFYWILLSSQSNLAVVQLEKEFNVLKHALVPEHTILNNEEKSALLQKLQIQPHQLPKILTTDPVVKAIGAKEGDIMKIIRKSPTAGESIYYRIVVK